jgi:formate/nitrite transporter FocA (FNT family)
LKSINEKNKSCNSCFVRGCHENSHGNHFLHIIISLSRRYFWICNFNLKRIVCMKNILNVLRSAIFAGIFIGVAGFGFLTATIQSSYGSLFGSVLFALGLLAIVGYKLKLFTGTAGFISLNEIGDLLVILLGNIIGCFLLGQLTRFSPMADAIQMTAYNIMATRIQTGAIGCGLLAIGCGLLMTTAVNFAREKNFLPLIFGVPLFIVCGFPHCVADAFYSTLYLLNTPNVEVGRFIAYYASIVAGNTIGCTLHRLFTK